MYISDKAGLPLLRASLFYVDSKTGPTFAIYSQIFLRRRIQTTLKGWYPL